MKKFLFLGFASLLAVISCSKKDKETEPEMSMNVSVESVSLNSVKVRSAIESDGGVSVTEYGFCYSRQNKIPTVNDAKVSLQVPARGFSSEITGLKAGTTYYVRAYAINKVGVGYGAIVTVTTEKGAPQMTSSNEKVESVSSSSAKVSYTIESDGGANITEKGFCYSTKENPTIADTKIVVIGGSLSMSATISKLSSNTTYYVRPYAKNSEGISYGEQIVVKTTVGMPTVTTSSASNITATGATLGGNVTADGGTTVMERGVCWSTSTNPTISSSKKAIGSGTGSFSSAITGLTEGTTYYVRAYATNIMGTVYGDQVTFRALEPVIVGGAIQAAFSISSRKKVYFSQGNLQYQASTNRWRFAEHQYDMIGEANKNISSTYSGWIDLFGWGTSGWYSHAKAYKPYSISRIIDDYYPGGSRYIDLTGSYANADWGVYNKISNGGNTDGMWRTLTLAEWEYLLKERTDASSLKGYATVNGVKGVILLPDNWTTPAEITFTSGTFTSGFKNNTYTVNEWAKMEANGAVFLPAAGYRDGTDVSDVGSCGYYWSSTAYGGNSGYLYASCLISNSMSGNYRNCGQSVRLVREL